MGRNVQVNAQRKGEQWWPEDWLVAQWSRHIEKIWANVRENITEDVPLRLVLKARDVSRYLTVSDGDGFMVAGLRVRLQGIDAPEIFQNCLDEKGREWPCGKRARRRLFELLRGREIEVHVHSVDRYGRLLATCYAGGRNVNETLVREGLAVTYYSDCYEEVQREARKARRGIWRGQFQHPAVWRRQHAEARPGYQQGEIRCKSKGFSPASEERAPSEESGIPDELRVAVRETKDTTKETANTALVKENATGESIGEVFTEWQKLAEAFAGLRALLKK